MSSAPLRLHRCAPRIALATFLCILSPIPLLLLIGISQDTRFAITEEARRQNRAVRSAGGRGAVPVLRRKGEYAFLEKEPLEVPPERSWVIWTVAGVLLGAVMTVMRLLNRKK